VKVNCLFGSNLNRFFAGGNGGIDCLTCLTFRVMFCRQYGMGANERREKTRVFLDKVDKVLDECAPESDGEPVVVESGPDGKSDLQ
jgi:hypothetical protein